MRESSAPAPAAPSRSFDEPASTRGTATIGKSVIVKGHIAAREDLFIDGELEGTLEAADSRVTVGPNGKITTSGIKARDIVVLGTIHGNVEASGKVEIRKDAKLVGDIKTARITIEDEAYFKGSVDIVRPEPKVQPKVTVAATPAADSSPRQQPLTTATAEVKK